MKQIQKLRIQKGISQGALAELLGVDSSTVAKWESGGIYPRAQLLPKLAQALGYTIDELFDDGKENKKCM